MSEGQYRIVKAQHPLIGGLAGHNFLVLIDPNGKVVEELHGLATGADGRPKPIGHLPSDELRGYVDQHFYRPDYAQAELASGDQAEITKIWNAGRAALDKINARSLHYPWMGLGQNSNSVNSTLIAAMGRSEPPMPGGASVMPGAGSMLLDPRDIQDIQRQFNIGAPRSGDAPNASARPEDVDQPNPLDSARWPFGPVGAPSGPAAVAPPRGLPGKAVPRAAGPTSLGGPDGQAPLEPAVRSRAPARSGPTAAPPLPPSFGGPIASPVVPAPAELGGIGSTGSGNGCGDWRASVAPGAGRAPLLFEDRWNALGQGGHPATPGDAAPPSRGYGLPSVPQLMFDPGSLRAPPQSLRFSPGSAGAAPADEVRRLTRMNASNSGNALAPGNAPASEADGMFAREPSHSISPPIWGFGFENRGGGQNEAEEWFARWIKPLLRQE